ncbi:MAG: hypothetical protein Q8R18_00385, partial [bacterium]|nr:hypothetical protein [bacterium]
KYSLISSSILEVEPSEVYSIEQGLIYISNNFISVKADTLDVGYITSILDDRNKVFDNGAVYIVELSYNGGNSYES